MGPVPAVQPPLPLVALRNYLVEQGLVRDPRTASDLPPMFLQPRDGARGVFIADAPGAQPTVEDDRNLVLSAFLTGGIPALPREHYWRSMTMEVWYRTAKAPASYPIEARIRRLLIDRQNWMMDTLRVIDSQEYRPLTPIGADHLGFAAQSAYLFQFYAEDLDPEGGPF